MSWRAATRALHAAGGGPIRRLDFWPTPRDGQNNSGSLYRARAKGLMVSSMLKYTAVWTLTQKGIDWCTGLIPDPDEVEPNPIDRDALVRRLAQGVDDALAEVRKLTPRQKEIMTLMACGLSSREIAPLLGVAVDTVESHRYAMMRRLGFERATEVAVLATKAGLV